MHCSIYTAFIIIIINIVLESYHLLTDRRLLLVLLVNNNNNNINRSLSCFSAFQFLFSTLILLTLESFISTGPLATCDI